MDRFSKYRAISDALRNKVCELELVSRLYLPSGSTSEVTNTRRAVCKKAVRRGNTTVLTFADIDRAALERVFPFETFTVGEFPDLYVDHVGWRIPQGVGTVTKVPMALISSATYTYGGPKVIGSAGTVLAVYRGNQHGQGSLVDSSEYTVGTTAYSGGTLLTVAFTREQVDFQGRQHTIDIDVSLPGSRYPSVEAERILALYGITADSTSFDAAETYDTSAGFTIDALYGYQDKGRTGMAIVEDLLAAARCWLSPTSSSNTWAVVQDSPKASSAEFDTSTDLARVDEYGDGDIPQRVTLGYRPRSSGLEDFAGQLTRETVATTGAGELGLRNPYVRDHTVADKLISYWQKRLNTLREARGFIHAVQLANGARIDVTDPSWESAKSFIITGINRPADHNVVKLREYDADIYTYTAGTLPDDATNTYTPDYSYTLPEAPAAPTTTGSGTSSDSDGKTTAYITVRAVPPSVNWATLWALVTDTTTNEQHRAQLVLNGANYEAVVGGLRPNRAHTVKAYAVNGNNVQGTLSAATNFTSANATTALGAPTVTVTQVQSKEVKVELAAVADVAGQPKLRRYVLFEKVGAGAYAEVKRSEERMFIRTVVHGTTYYYKARTEDQIGNESADSAETNITPAKTVDGDYIVDGSINRGRSATGTTTYTGSINNGFRTGFSFGPHAFVPSLTGDANMKLECFAPQQSDDQGYLVFNNDTGAARNYKIVFRNFNA